MLSRAWGAEREWNSVYSVLPLSDQEFLAQVDAGIERWEARWSGGAPDLIYHYTDAAGFVGIVERNELWSTDAGFLNDSTELVYIDEILAEVIAELRVRYATDGVVLGLIQEVERQYRVTIGNLFDVYVSCFCERRDQLSQWRGYSSTGGGYALGFRSSCVGRMPGLLRRVVYDRDTQVMLVREAMNPLCQAMAGIPASDAQRIVDLSISRIGALGGMLSECGYSCKHPAFEEEAEWRLVTLRPRDATLIPPGVTVDTSPPHVRATVRGLLPYIKKPLLPDDRVNLPITEVVIGPGPQPDLARKGAIQLLAGAGYPNPDQFVRHSLVPLRS
jgi:Protein of unknown function (DUF2971)